jgi:hypothetical protein
VTRVHLGAPGASSPQWLVVAGPPDRRPPALHSDAMLHSHAGPDDLPQDGVHDTGADGPHPYQGQTAVLVTMHGKEQVLQPLLTQAMGLKVGLACGVDTDRFGTFSRDVARPGSALDAARAKIAAGFEADPAARVGLASEGSFGAHPALPFLPFAEELVFMIDRKTGFELAGHDRGVRTNFASALIRDPTEAATFAARVGFPSHGVVVTASRDGVPAPDLYLEKEAVDLLGLEAAVGRALAHGGPACLETDMRAHRNPMRMEAIERAVEDLVRRFASRCPACRWRGFSVTSVRRGLPCAWCGDPTHAPVAEMSACPACGHVEERPLTTATTADPGQCAACNP